MKFAIGFKDDGTIMSHKVIERGTTWWGPAMMNQQLHDEAGLQVQADDSWLEIEGKVKSVIRIFCPIEELKFWPYNEVRA
jgi:hypothetical protein